MIWLRQYTDADFNTYEDFVLSSINGTIFHQRQFLNYHPIDRFQDNTLMIFKSNILIGVFPAALITKNNINILKSHPGASYGGLIIKENLSYSKINNIFEIIEQYCKQNEINFVEFRHSPKIFLKERIDQIEFCLIKRDYIRDAEELSTFYDLEKIRYLSDEQYYNTYSNSTHSKIKQCISTAIKNNLSFEFAKSNAEIERYYQIIESNLEKHNVKPVHSLDEIKKLLELLPDRIKIPIIKLNDEIIAGFLIFNVNSTGWHIFYSSLDYNYSKFKPIHFGVYKLKRYLADMAYRYLNYGISTENSGKYVNETLLNFKESFNGEGILRTYWKKEIL
jgi:Cdc6-like AAA superfamily ATPase